MALGTVYRVYMSSFTNENLLKAWLFCESSRRSQDFAFSSWMSKRKSQCKWKRNVNLSCLSQLAKISLNFGFPSLLLPQPLPWSSHLTQGTGPHLPRLPAQVTEFPRVCSKYWSARQMFTVYFPCAQDGPREWKEHAVCWLPTICHTLSGTFYFFFNFFYLLLFFYLNSISHHTEHH